MRFTDSPYEDFMKEKSYFKGVPPNLPPKGSRCDGCLYAKTRPAFDGYKAAKYSRKYLAEHEAELADYRAAKATMAELLGGEKLPKMDVLKEKRRQLAARKKALYLEYRKAQQDMRELVAVKGSVDHLRRLTDNQRNKEQAR